MKPTPRPPMRRRRSPRGQAMVEYSFLNYALLFVLVMTFTVKFDTGGGTHTNVIDAFLKAYQIYYDSYYFVLNLPFP